MLSRDRAPVRFWVRLGADQGVSGLAVLDQDLQLRQHAVSRRPIDQGQGLCKPKHTSAGDPGLNNQDPLGNSQRFRTQSGEPDPRMSGQLMESLDGSRAAKRGHRKHSPSRVLPKGQPMWQASAPPHVVDEVGSEIVIQAGVSANGSIRPGSEPTAQRHCRNCPRTLGGLLRTVDRRLL